MAEPRRIWWARPRKLCALERPGGGGRNHRAERRAAEIEYLRSRAGAAGGVDDAHAPQPRRLRRGGARLAPRAGGRAPRTGRRRSRSCCRCCAARLARTRRRGHPRRPPHGLRGRGVRGAPARVARGATRRSRWPARRPAGLDGDAGGVRADRRAAERGGRLATRPQSGSGAAGSASVSPTATGWGSKPSSAERSLPSLQHQRGVEARRRRRGQVGAHAVAHHQRAALAEPVERGAEQLRLGLADDLRRALSWRTPRRPAPRRCRARARPAAGRWGRARWPAGRRRAARPGPRCAGRRRRARSCRPPPPPRRARRGRWR